MERRNFFKLVGMTSGAALTGACGKPGQELIPLLVPEKQIVPGVEEWHPSVCRECSAGCGTIVRVMEAEREIEIEGEKVRQPIAAIKKIEGNPLDPVSGGRLCARGQAGLQSLYHPDRLRGPQKRSGERGAGGFEAISWDEALQEATDVLTRALDAGPQEIVYLSRPGAGTRAATVQRFLDAIGAPRASTTGVADFTVERVAAEQVYGWSELPVYEIQDATFVLSIGADFLASWASPVLYARRFGHMRQGRRGIRGRLVHAESRLSQTGWSADEWLPVKPGGEQALALALGHILLKEGWAKDPTSLPPAVKEVYEALDVDRAVELSGIPLKQIREVARSLFEATAPLVVAGASIVRPNSLESVVAASVLNLLLGNVNEKGGVHAPSEPLLSEFEEDRPRYENLLRRLDKANVVLLDGTNPAYQVPASAERLAKCSAVISFSPFVDDSSAYADLILPDHSALESAAALVPTVTPKATLTGSRSFVQPLYDTRATEEVLGQLAGKLGKSIEVETTQRVFGALYEKGNAGSEFGSEKEFAAYCERQGGWWMEAAAASSPPPLKSIAALTEPESHDADADYPLVFQAYPSLQFSEGSGANLPWLQELPDPTSSAMWGLPVEIDPKTAAALDVVNGQIVRVTSPEASLEAPVYVNPAAIPGVISMAIGQGHTHYGRYASGRGANPLSLVSGIVDRQTGVPALGDVRVRIEKVGERRGLVQFSAVDREVHARRL